MGALVCVCAAEKLRLGRCDWHWLWQHAAAPLQTDIFANEDGTIPEADAAAASLLAQHNPATLPQPTAPAGPSGAPSGGAGAAAPGYAGQGQQPGQAMAMQPPGTDGGAPQGGGAGPGGAYQYAPWPGMHQGMPPPQHQHMMAAGNMDPKMQARPALLLHVSHLLVEPCTCLPLAAQLCAVL